jgi:hypothetical protein
VRNLYGHDHPAGAAKQCRQEAVHVIEVRQVEEIRDDRRRSQVSWRRARHPAINTGC